jgi:TfoX/Sxy family transcriptional regulator of competence genes
MAYDTALAERVRAMLQPYQGVAEKKMFGGLTFMINNHMCCGVEKTRLMVRVGPEKYEEVLQDADAVPMDFTGRALRGFIYVEPEGIASQESLRHWLALGIAYVQQLPPK